MSETASFREPVYWRIGEGDWHEDYLTAWEAEPLSEHGLAQALRGDAALWAYCHETEGHVGNPGVEVRRDVPPTGEQCAKCRAAKAGILREAGKLP